MDESTPIQIMLGHPKVKVLSAEEVAQLLAALLPPEDREGAKLVERMIKLAISLNYMLSRSPSQKWQRE